MARSPGPPPASSATGPCTSSATAASSGSPPSPKLGDDLGGRPRWSRRGQLGHVLDDHRAPASPKTRSPSTVDRSKNSRLSLSSCLGPCHRRPVYSTNDNIASSTSVSRESCVPNTPTRGGGAPAASFLPATSCNSPWRYTCANWRFRCRSSRPSPMPSRSSSKSSGRRNPGSDCRRACGKIPRLTCGSSSAMDGSCTCFSIGVVVHRGGLAGSICSLFAPTDTP